MFVQLLFFSFLFPYCLTIRNNSSGICQAINLCPKKMKSCYPVVMKCQSGSCRFRRFSSNNNQRLIVSRWFYDSNHQRCRRNTNQTDNFVYFHFRRDCRRLCSNVRQKKTVKTSFLHVTDSTYNYNDTVYVNLHIDLSPSWIQKLAGWMNMSTHAYNSQVHYFQNYRRRFTNFIDPSYQLKVDHQQNIAKKNY